MSSPSWRQLAAIPESLLKSKILHALNMDVPLEGVSHTFNSDGWYMEKVQDGWVVYVARPDHPPASYGFPEDGGSDALRAARCPAGTPTGDALRAFMRRWGWVPKNERPAVEPNDNTKTII